MVRKDFSLWVHVKKQTKQKKQQTSKKKNQQILSTFIVAVKSTDLEDNERSFI